MSVDTGVESRLVGSVGAQILPGLVAGFPAEGCYVQVMQDEVIAAAGWFSIDPVSVSDGMAGVVVVWRDPTLGAAETSLRHWAGRVEAGQVRKLDDPYPSPMPWFGDFAAVLHSGAASRREAAALRERLGQMRVEHASWITRMSESACEYADRNNLCSEFESFMEEWGLEGRAREHEVEVTVRTSATVTVRARSQRAAEELVDEGAVRDCLGGRSWRYAELEFTVEPS